MYPRAFKGSFLKMVNYVTFSLNLHRHNFGEKDNTQEVCVWLDVSRGLPQKQNVQVCLILPRITFVFTDLCIPWLVYLSILRPLSTVLHSMWSVTDLLLVTSWCLYKQHISMLHWTVANSFDFKTINVQHRS